MKKNSYSAHKSLSWTIVSKICQRERERERKRKEERLLPNSELTIRAKFKMYFNRLNIYSRRFYSSISNSCISGVVSSLSQHWPNAPFRDKYCIRCNFLAMLRFSVVFLFLVGSDPDIHPNITHITPKEKTTKTKKSAHTHRQTHPCCLVNMFQTTLPKTNLYSISCVHRSVGTSSRKNYHHVFTNLSTEIKSPFACYYFYRDKKKNWEERHEWKRKQKKHIVEKVREKWTKSHRTIFTYRFSISPFNWMGNGIVRARTRAGIRRTQFYRA